MRIFVGGLPRTATKDDIVRLFRRFGAEESGVVLPRDRRTRRRKGVAYVELADPVQARAAIAVFAGFAVEGKLLTVCAADERPVKGRRVGRGLPRKLGALAFVIGAVTASVAGPARGAEAGVDIGLTLNPVLGGIHESYRDITHVPPVPIPLIEARGRYGPFELDLQGLPPLASVRSYSPLEGHTSTTLSIFEGFARVWDPLHRFSAGIGQTLYNQSTHYIDPVEIAGTGETQFSRVTGVTYQAGYGVALGRGRFEATVNYAPAMRGTQFTIYDVATNAPRADPERAEQVDTSVRYVRAAGARGEFMLGLRYVNYTARYDETRGGLSDRNVGLLPVIGYRVRLGP